MVEGFGRREGPVAVPGQRALRRAKAERAEVPRDVGGGFGFVQTDLTKEYGAMMEKMRLAMEQEKKRLSVFHKYTDESVDQPFLTPDTVKDA